ncbi:nucleotidyltransferase domain-containing protein [Empedobacter tilapiae]|uniref:nucleotidyltransferase domain-containing protein n=1 Tax=Empedobacter tilapiae TaxID=2491114 RepID=UPI0028D0EFED|nr:nucleotidyltransferase domain-containing protein [Empedobacter tilapiae]
MNNFDLIFYLKTSLNKNYIVNSFIFGSIAKGSNNPNDCDLFIVTNQLPHLKEWKEFLKELESVQSKFQEIFKIKLHITINTENEFLEYSPFKDRILKRPSIKII